LKNPSAEDKNQASPVPSIMDTSWSPIALALDNYGTTSTSPLKYKFWMIQAYGARE
jgi:hypothetical protein